MLRIFIGATLVVAGIAACSEAHTHHSVAVDQANVLAGHLVLTVARV
jgi:hypothetical protein